jgi:VanZ family protein
VTASSRILWAWFWVAVCVAAILAMSGEAFAGMHTGRYLTPFLKWLFPESSGRQILDVHFAVRKAAHLTEYAVLAMFSLRALRLTIDVSILRIVGLTLVIVLAVAGVDELRQAHLDLRTGSVWDVVINLVGGSIGVLLVIAVHRVFGVGAPAPKGET